MTVSAKSYVQSPGIITTLSLALAALAIPANALADPDSHDPRGQRGGGVTAPQRAVPNSPAPAPFNQPAPRPAPVAQPAPAAPPQHFGSNGGGRPDGAPAPTPPARNGWNGSIPAQPAPIQPAQPQGGWNNGRPAGNPGGQRPEAPRQEAPRQPDGRGNDGWRGQPGWNGTPGWNGDRRGPDQNRPAPRVEYRGPENYRPAYRDNDNRGWSHDWRRDNRYDWQGWRSNNRMAFHVGRYYPPYRGYAYRRLSVGIFLQPLFFTDTYRIYDPWTYHLPPVYGPYQWVRYYDDAVLVDIYTGAVADVLYDFFW